MKETFAPKTFAAKTFASGTFAGLGVTPTGTTPDGLDFAVADSRPFYAAESWQVCLARVDARPHYSLADNAYTASVTPQVAEIDEDGFAEELEQGGLSLME